jgi:putative membrane protein
MKILFKWFLSAFALMSLSYIDSGITINGFESAMIATLVIGFLNLFVRPVLVILTLPVTLISLGLFLFVINAFFILDGLYSSEWFSDPKFRTCGTGLFDLQLLGDRD